ncbi:MAG: SpoIIE family protein phosphatase [Candidatus Eisenbacteria bacterium]|uniref:SpoIIE family protein phosphatase n=1 Tax=Eiseniibacteriota bacterium TaxID=2212470 RepID=A0A933W921_UNCEI|nr:SpoIIE family protein phosphatase [Candidatus Eisenbacteria bacterium]
MNEPRPETSIESTAAAMPAGTAAELFEASLRIVPTLDLRDVGAQLLAPLVRATSAKRASLMVINPETGRLRIVAGMGLRPELIGRDTEWRPNSISEWVYRKHQGLVLNGEVRGEALNGTAEQAIESALCVPLESHEGILGVLNLARTAPAPVFQNADLEALSAMLPPVAAAIERAMQAQRAEQLAQQLRDSSGLSGRTLLPTGTFESRFYEVAYARLASAYEGGDTADRVPHANGAQSLLVADVAGDGVEAALTAAFVQGLFVSGCTAEASPAAIVSRIGSELHLRSGGRRTTALWLAQLSPGGLLTCTNAGYPPPLWVPSDDNPVSMLAGNTPSAGTSAQDTFEDEQVRLLPGDLVVAVSDGVLGARNVMGQTFGYERLTEYLVELRRQPLDLVVNDIVKAIRNWSGRPVPTDDVTVLAIRFTPGR